MLKRKIRPERLDSKDLERIKERAIDIRVREDCIASPSTIVALVEEVERYRNAKSKRRVPMPPDPAVLGGSAFVDEVAARHQHPTSDEGTSYCPLAESLAREVGELRELLESATGEDIARDVGERIDALQAMNESDEQWRHLASALAITAAKAIANGRWAVEEHRWATAEKKRADALARKAEAGKALYEWVFTAPHRQECAVGRVMCNCGLVAALAQWETAEQGEQ